MDLKSIVIDVVADVAGLELSNTAIIEIATLVEEKFTSTNSAMDAIRKAYIEGYSMGHHHTVESCYCPEQAADDWLSEQRQ